MLTDGVIMVALIRYKIHSSVNEVLSYKDAPSRRYRTLFHLNITPGGGIP